MHGGQVIWVANDNLDNLGQKKNPAATGDANFVVIRSDDLDCYQIYYHFKQGSIVVAKDDSVNPGDPLGLAGNSGGTTEPHLHLGINRRDANGFIRSLPMTFQKIKNSSGKTVTGVPVDGETYIGA